MTRVLALALAMMVSSFAFAFYNIYRADRASDKSREALCQVLLYVRKAGLAQARSEQQMEQIKAFYGDLIGLVERCHPPNERT